MSDTSTVRSKRILSPKVAGRIDWLLVLLAFASGVLHPKPGMYYDSQWRVFLVIIIPLLLASGAVYWFAERFGERIQGPRRKSPPLLKEGFETTRAMFVVACLAAWPIGLARAGHPTGLVWTLEQMGVSWWVVILQMVAGIVLIDAWTYWKHRLLHTRMLFAFHRHHHSFRDPTPFAGFAVGPLETLLTFCPLLLICWPQAKHFAPMYFTAIISFVLLNLYLHCGVTYRWMERLIPALGLNSSAWHNVHHSDVHVNFGEVSYIWDRICGTAKAEEATNETKRTSNEAGLTSV
ncbi:MAG: sterol desaturase family protein [Deltaproteobacteria bacterium]|nr:MAG: sterol desaturase family protein [Deltaproteobacteria bacterium]